VRFYTVWAEHRNNHVKTSEAEIAKALQGNWREEHLFALKQAVALYDAYAVQLMECDLQLEKMLRDLAKNDLEADKPKRRGGKSKNAPHFDARTLLLQICGVNLTRIDGIDFTTAFKVMAVVGARIFQSLKMPNISPPGWDCALARKYRGAKSFRPPPPKTPTVPHKHSSRQR
jgi:hypothetical protein